MITIFAACVGYLFGGLWGAALAVVLLYIGLFIMAVIV